MLWVAQGHVCTEDLGSSYIEQLVDRWLMEISKVDFYGKVRSCKMHSLFYEVAVKCTVYFMKWLLPKCWIRHGGRSQDLRAEHCRQS